MFKIDNNMSIKISQGDDAIFPLFLNQGSVDRPIRYPFSPGDGNEVYFYIFDLNDKRLDQPVLYKIFHTPELGSTTGIVETYINGIKQSNIELENIINDNFDLQLLLETNDTRFIEPGQYKYQVKAKLKDKNNVYFEHTVTNKHDIFIINDDYSNRIWE